MRWFAWLVALCLVAAGAVRSPPAPTLDQHEVTVDDASDLASLVPRRPTPFTLDKRADRRLELAAPPVVLIAHSVSRTRLASAVRHPAQVAAPGRRAQSSRGPPPAHSAASRHTS
jgi:hypothetical protein